MIEVGTSSYTVDVTQYSVLITAQVGFSQWTLVLIKLMKAFFSSCYAD